MGVMGYGNNTNNTNNYRLKVTAGPDYDPSTHQVVPVNSDQTLRFENSHAIVNVCVRIQGYTGTHSWIISFPFFCLYVNLLWPMGRYGTDINAGIVANEALKDCPTILQRLPPHTSPIRSINRISTPSLSPLSPSTPSPAMILSSEMTWIGQFGTVSLPASATRSES